MFFGMLFALPMYLALEARKRIRARSDPALRAELDAAPPITVHPRLEPSLAGADAREPLAHVSLSPDAAALSRCVTC